MIVHDADTTVAILNSVLDLAVHFLSIYIKIASKVKVHVTIECML